MALTERDVVIQHDTADSIEKGKENFDVSKLKYAVNSKGENVIYLEKFKEGIEKVCDFKSIIKYWHLFAQQEADDAAEAIRKKIYEQKLSDEMKKYRDLLKKILKQAEKAKKQFEAELKQKRIDTSKSDWFENYATLFDEQ